MGRYNRRHIVLCLVAIFLIAFISLCVKSCSRLIDDPEKGSKKALLYNDEELTDSDRLLVNGASVGRQTNIDKFNVTELLRFDGVTIDNFYRQTATAFGLEASDMTDSDLTEGILTYRGSSLRQGAVYGTAAISSEVFSSTWEIKLGDSLLGQSYLTRAGQPLVIKWSDDMRSMIKISEGKKKKSSLTEVIYASSDGRIYFMDLDDGTYTRNPIDLGVPITGTGTISSEGAPLYVIGCENSADSASAEVYVIDLIKGEVIYNFGSPSLFSEDALESDYGFSASALFSDALDCLITQGENGIIYSLNVSAANLSGTLEADFSGELEYTYSVQNSEDGEVTITTTGASQAAWGDYIYSVDAEGNISCIDVNDWHMIWMRKLGDKVDATPVIEVDKAAGTAYIYIGTALAIEDGKSNSGKVYLYKLNAANGNIIWQQEYEASVTKKTDGGAVSAALSGRNDLSDYVYFNIAGYDGKKSGTLVCLDKTTGSEKYTIAMKNYSLSDVTAVYNDNGTGYLIICDIKGNIFMLNGKTGEVTDTRSVGERIVSNPAIFNDTLIIASESRIYGIKLE